jgi:hypothetical protein
VAQVVEAACGRIDARPSNRYRYAHNG